MTETSHAFEGARHEAEPERLDSGFAAVAVQRQNSQCDPRPGSKEVQCWGSSKAPGPMTEVELVTPVGNILMHVILHGARPRGQVARTLGRVGGTVVSADYITVVRESS